MGALFLDERPCVGHGCSRVARNGGECRRAEAGQALCRGCGGRLGTEIREFPRLYAECGVALGGHAPGGIRERTTGGRSPGLELNARAAEARTRIVTLLGSWSGLVAQERRTRAPRRQVAPMADFLLANLVWLAAHPAAGELSAEVARAAGAARRAARPDAVRRVVVGTCVARGCDGQLAATVRASRAGQGTEVRCDTDPTHVWDGPAWTRLRRELAGPAPTAERWLATADVARLWRTPTGTVYRLASEQGWRRVTRAGRAYYAEEDVHGTFARRAARTAAARRPRNQDRSVEE